jgi:hypothetical protein
MFQVSTLLFTFATVIYIGMLITYVCDYYECISFFTQLQISPEMRRSVVTCTPITRQRLGKHVPAVNTLNNTGAVFNMVRAAMLQQTRLKQCGILEDGVFSAVSAK